MRVVVVHHVISMNAIIGLVLALTALSEAAKTKTDLGVDSEQVRVRLHELSPRIIGGEQVPPGAYPYFAGTAANGQYACGAALIAPDILISTASCGVQAFPTHAIVNASALGLLTSGAVEVTILEHYIDSDYDQERVTNDIMIMKIHPPLSTIVPISVNSDPNLPVDGESLQVMGFGQTLNDASTKLGDPLMQTTLQKLSDQECESLYAVNPEKTLCAIDLDPVRNICIGDGGGPLIDSNGALVGLASWVGGSCESGWPSGFTRLSKFYDWIANKVCKFSENAPAEFKCPDSEPTTGWPTPSPNTRRPTSIPTLSTAPSVSPKPTPITTAAPSPLTLQPTPTDTPVCVSQWDPVVECLGEQLTWLEASSCFNCVANLNPDNPVVCYDFLPLCRIHDICAPECRQCADLYESYMQCTVSAYNTGCASICDTLAPTQTAAPSSSTRAPSPAPSSGCVQEGKRCKKSKQCCNDLECPKGGGRCGEESSTNKTKCKKGNSKCATGDECCSGKCKEKKGKAKCK
jgi:trypsin